MKHARETSLHGLVPVAAMLIVGVVLLPTLWYDGSAQSTYQKRSLLGYTKDNEWLHNLPHQTIDGKDIEPSLFVSSTNDYVSSLWAIALVPMFVGVFAGLVGLCFCMFRWSFDLCGSVHPNRGGYSPKERRIVKIMVFVMGLLMLPMIVLCAVGNERFAPLIDNFVDNLQDRAQVQYDLIAPIYPALLEVNETETLRYEPADIVNAGANNTLKNADNGESYIRDNNLYRLIIFGFVIGFLCLVVILGTAGAIFNVHGLSLFVGLFSFFVLFLVWVNISIHFSLSVVVADVCYDVYDYTIPRRMDDRYNDNGTYGGLNDFIRCVSFDNTQITIGLAQELMQQNIDYLNSTTNSTLAAQYQYNIDLMNSTIYRLNDVLNCTWVETVFTPIQSEMCDKNLTGVIYVWASSFVLSILLIPMIILNIMGWKRFRRQDGGGFF